MRKSNFFAAASLWLFLFSCVAFAQNFQTVGDGVEYAQLTKQTATADGKIEPVIFNLLRLDLTKVRLDVVHAMDAAIGLEKTSSIAERYGAIAAINAGFFRIDKSIYEGDNVSTLIIDGKLFSENTNDRITLFIENEKTQTQVSIEKAFPSVKLNSRKNRTTISGINRERKMNELILFTPEFHLTTLTGNDGLEIAVSKGRIIQISDGKGSSRIPADGFVLSASGKFRVELKSLKIGDQISVESSFQKSFNDPTNAFGMRAIEDAVSGVPQLIKNGAIEITWQEEKQSKSFVETKHPRTAVAKLKDGKFLMVVVDGRSEASGGISLPDLAAFLLEQDAIDAMNLDGGGSSTMFLDGKVVNKPSDKEGERKIGDAILVFPRKKN